MQVTNQREIIIEAQMIKDIKPYNTNPYEFSRITYICITALTFVLMVFLTIKFLS